MVQYSNLIRAMETSDHFKNGVNSKKHSTMKIKYLEVAYNE